MTTPCAIREARPQDLDDLVELLGLLFSIESDFSPDRGKQRAGLEMMLAAGPRVVLVAGSFGAGPDRVVGMATAQEVVSTAEGGPALLVEDVVVRPEARGHGVGRALVMGLEAWGRGRGATRMQLLADKDNLSATAFYDKCDFSTTNLVCLRRALSAAEK